ncbi:ABC transporter permease [uncultured Brachybacterium sp.]|uniref:ABC transporter permease n=1 Tax=uncultured Brachybacterium sp. TaxID=189680 RepID=UPI002629150A|nr:ABC transporter permease [uncultured Brachybacterium sp.]
MSAPTSVPGPPPTATPGGPGSSGPPPAGRPPGGSTPGGPTPGGPTPGDPAPDSPGPDGPAPSTRRRPLNGILSLRPRGLWLVTSLELRQRIRSVRWYVALAVWTLVLLGIGGLGLAPTLYTAQWDSLQPVAAVIFSLQVILVLFAMLLVVPALSAGSINGDRTAGTLATLQASLLSPLEIVLGKLLAGFLTGLAFLVLALPSVVPIAVLGGIGFFYFLRIVLVIALLTLCVTAVGLGLSAVTNRQLGSVVLAYVIVFGVSVVLPIAWGSTAIFLQQEREVTEYYSTYETDGTSPARCVAEQETRSVPRIDLTMPLLWGNPVVLLAEASPPLPSDYWAEEEENADALRVLKLGMREVATIAHPAHQNFCDPGQEGYPEELAAPPNRPIWPMGLALWMFAGGISLAVATWRLAVPIRHLGSGTRIA